MESKILDEIESYLVTQQQETGFTVYKQRLALCGTPANCERFQQWYQNWCAEEGLFPDLNLAHFPPAERYDEED